MGLKNISLITIYISYYERLSRSYISTFKVKPNFFFLWNFPVISDYVNFPGIRKEVFHFFCALPIDHLQLGFFVHHSFDKLTPFSASSSSPPDNIQHLVTLFSNIEVPFIVPQCVTHTIDRIFDPDNIAFVSAALKV